MMTVAEIVPQIRALDGKVVRVAGYLPHCQGYECRLYPDKKGAQEEAAYFEALKREMHLRNQGLPFDPKAVDKLEHSPQIGIGSDEGFAFDRKAATFIPGYVVITGRVTSRCRDENNRPGCTDRSTDLEPTDIRAWTPSEGAPANTK